MISVVYSGRFGNQLFQYAFVYALSRKLRTPFFVHGYDEATFVVLKYFQLRRFERIRLLYAKLLYYFFRLFGKPKRLTQTGWDKAGDILVTAENNKSAIWNGFFQSVEYFEAYREEIRSLFEPRQSFRDAFNKKYGALINGERKLAVIHIRRTDYIEWGNDRLGGKNMTLPMSYYAKCIEMVRMSDYHTLVLSDDIEFVKDYFKSSSGLYFEHNDEIIDHMLLTHADLLIASNSSFAWWGAFMNKRNVRVFAPEFWLGFKIREPYPVDIMSNLNWTWVNVT